MAHAYATAQERIDEWTLWQQDVVAVIRRDFPEILDDVGANDIDWDAWRSLYEQGHSAQDAVDRAFLRNL